MLCVWVHGCDPGRVSDGSRLILYQTLSIEYPFSIFYWHALRVNCPLILVVFLFCFVLMLSLELCRCSSDVFLSSRPRTGLATTYIAGYGSGPIGLCEEHKNIFQTNPFAFCVVVGRSCKGRTFQSTV